ncbi:hypothetical protein [Paraburkholderia caribensis]|uniref:hypothetical protein n=1 Tax=Paraburkholderia caribensis TaxID=75105 RepID=UPI0028570952|nr:hypothetical protein [Paraburkholderia caribensis]MDR6384025.1 hypothetical protein [Paraburkholderia caribensis]
MVELALGFSPEFARGHVPAICFDLAPELAGLGASPIADVQHGLVAGQLQEAYAWCAERFPLLIRDADMNPIPAICEIHAAQRSNLGEYLTASSSRRPYRIFVAAPWPLSSVYRLGSLLAHEAIHQALYNRERIASVARPWSLAYSPWKQRLRPGRLVWHAAWTFSTQFALLCDAVLNDGEAMLAADPDILGFIAEMEARIVRCIESLETFEILGPEEANGIAGALAETAWLACNLAARHADYAVLRSQWSESVAREIQTWSESGCARIEIA